MAPSEKHPKALAEMVRVLPGISQGFSGGQKVTGIVFDSRRVKPDNIFVALVGENVDGHRYIPEAIERGACAVVGTMPLQGLMRPYFQVIDSRLALALLSAAFYGFPARHLTVIGITGTDGKTTTANLLFHLLQSAGIKTGMISTVNAIIGDQTLDTGFHVTTPEAPDIQRYLANMVAAGLEIAILEATSHGLQQHRLSACDFDIGIVTNITHEHLDYHGSYAAYRAAKARLFTSLAETPRKTGRSQQGAVLNRDDSSYEYLADLVQVRQVSYGLDSLAEVTAEQIQFSSSGTRFTTVIKDRAGQKIFLPIVSRLQGKFNLSNTLAVLTTCLQVLELHPEPIQHAVASFPGVPGRMENIRLESDIQDRQNITTIVDFAHTPNALSNALMTARKLTDEQVIVVFGSAGLRDRAKRRLMAEIAITQADLSIFTAEDPRTETLDSILEEMAEGAGEQGGKEGKNFWRIPDRGEAIVFALTLAKPGDLILVCGKGHEQSMCFGEVEYPWDDRLAVRAALADYFDLPGPEMPILPTTKNYQK